jgi:glycosyltransferase involved in cell wall biosynthesis
VADDLRKSIASERASAATATAGSLPLVSLVMPIYNEGRFIAKSLDQVLAQEYPADRLEVIVADGMSTDETRQIVGDYERNHPQIKLVDNPARFRAAGLNVAIANSTGDVVICIDGHGETAPDFVRQNVTLFEEHPEAWSVGGPYRPSGHTTFGKAVAIAMSHPCGVGLTSHRFPEFEGYVEGAPFAAFRRWVFDRVGWFDEQLVRTEDDEFNYRIAQAGGKIFISPRVRYDYYVRDSVRKLFQQYIQYSFWRIPVVQKHKRPTTIRQVVPPLFFLTMIVLAIVGAVLRQPIVALALPIVYVATLALVGISTIPKAGVKVACFVPVAMATMHVAYALGIAYGLFAAVFQPRAWEPSGSMSQQKR